MTLRVGRPIYACCQCFGFCGVGYRHKKHVIGWGRKQVPVGSVGWRRRNTVIERRVASHPACEQRSLKLSQNQKRVCQLYPDHMDSVNAGVQLAREECQYQLEWRRWNCSTSRNSSLTDSTASSGMYATIITLLIVTQSVNLLSFVGEGIRETFLPHFSAKRGLAIACGLSVRLPVCQRHSDDVGGL